MYILISTFIGDNGTIGNWSFLNYLLFWITNPVLLRENILMATLIIQLRLWDISVLSLVWKHPVWIRFFTSFFCRYLGLCVIILHDLPLVTLIIPFFLVGAPDAQPSMFWIPIEKCQSNKKERSFLSLTYMCTWLCSFAQHIYMLF